MKTKILVAVSILILAVMATVPAHAGQNRGVLSNANASLTSLNTTPETAAYLMLGVALLGIGSIGRKRHHVL